MKAHLIFHLLLLEGEVSMGDTSDAGSNRVDQELSYPHGDEGAVDMHCVLVLEIQHMHSIRVSQMPSHPLPIQ